MLCHRMNIEYGKAQYCLMDIKAQIKEKRVNDIPLCIHKMC